MTITTALADVLPYLRCTVCGESLSYDGERIGCANAHRFDVARQGYLNLAVGSASRNTGDNAAMVQARFDFLSADHYRPIAAAVAAAVSRDTQLLVDLGGGTGYYLAAALDAVPSARGVCLDRSTAALRRAVRAHPHGAAVGCDVWQGIPVQDAGADAVLDVFSPRNGAEIRRVLSPGGRLIVVTPTPRHLAELVGPLGMLSVDEDKATRLDASLHGFTTLDTRTVEYEMTLGRTSVVDLVAMGPAAWHTTTAEIGQRAEQLPDPVQVTVSVDVATMTPGDD